ncbi:MAG: E2/UBC family protein [Acidimicrobiia bacterium]
MRSLRPGEWEQLARCFPDATITDGADGTSIIAVPNLVLPAGWSMGATSVWFVVPIGYPAAQPDCFWSDPDLRLATGAMPSNAAPQALPLLETPALWFSWHLAAWRPSYDSISTYARFVLRRFDDAR